jgi:hypothetical protein
MEEGSPRWSYDEEIDAFYVRIADGPAQRQRSARGTAQVDRDGRLVSIEIRLRP